MGDVFGNMAEGNKTNYRGKGIASKSDDPSQSIESKVGLYPFTKEQYTHIMNLLKNMNDNNIAPNSKCVSSSNVAGID